MSPEDQRIAIAEIVLPSFRKWTADELARGWRTISPPGCAVVDSEEEYLPDYVHDLNEMYAAEAGLLGEQIQMIIYQSILSKICPKNPHVSCWDLIHASAAQRAEAFLKTLGKWKD